MAITLKQITTITLVSTGTDYESCVVAYTCGSTDDKDLEAGKSKKYVLKDADKTKAEALWTVIKAKIKADEGL